MKAVTLTKLLAIDALDKISSRLIVSGLLAPATRRRDPDTSDNLANQLLAWNRRGLVDTVLSVLLDRTTIREELADIRTPTLVVSGAEDRTLPTTHSRHLVANLSDATLVEVPDAAHLVPLEQPEAANALILEFLDESVKY